MATKSIGFGNQLDGRKEELRVLCGCLCRREYQSPRKDMDEKKRRRGWAHGKVMTS